jgi:hypothetical protein
MIMSTPSDNEDLLEELLTTSSGEEVDPKILDFAIKLLKGKCALGPFI